MKIICSWCKKFMGEKEPLDDSSETHAKCSKCLKKQNKETKRQSSEIPKDDHLPRTFSFSDEFLERTRKFWEPRYGHPLTLEDAREISNNMCGFFTLLAEADRKQKERIGKV